MDRVHSIWFDVGQFRFDNKVIPQYMQFIYEYTIEVTR